jgi:class 3 adenylate cyclase
MDDVRAVMDAAGSERAVLFGYSEGGPMCFEEFLTGVRPAPTSHRVLGTLLFTDLVGSTEKARRDLVAGSGLAFEDRGEHELKGLGERRRVFRSVE